MAQSVPAHRRSKPATKQDAWDKFWKDRDGNIVVWQRPNIFLIGWAVLALASLFLTGKVANILWYAALAVLAAWALLEIFKGVNYLRRTLGVVVLLMIIMAVVHTL